MSIRKFLSLTDVLSYSQFSHMSFFCGDLSPLSLLLFWLGLFSQYLDIFWALKQLPARLVLNQPLILEEMPVYYAEWGNKVVFMSRIFGITSWL